MEGFYQESWDYKWIKSKAKFLEVEAVDTFNDLLSPEFYKNGELLYVIDEKQLYKAKHVRNLKRVGR